MEIGPTPGCRGCSADSRSHTKDCVERFLNHYGEDELPAVADGDLPPLPISTSSSSSLRFSRMHKSRLLHTRRLEMQFRFPQKNYRKIPILSFAVSALNVSTLAVALLHQSHVPHVQILSNLSLHTWLRPRFVQRRRGDMVTVQVWLTRSHRRRACSLSPTWSRTFLQRLNSI